MCACMRLCTPYLGIACRGQKRVLGLPKLELQAVESCCVVLGTKLGFFARVINFLDHSAIFPAPPQFFILKSSIMLKSRGA